MHSTNKVSRPAKRLNPINPLALSPLPMIMSIWNTSRLTKEREAQRDREDAIIAAQQKKIRKANERIWAKRGLRISTHDIGRSPLERDIAPAHNRGLFKADGATVKVWNYLRAVDEPNGLTVQDIHHATGLTDCAVRGAIGMLVKHRIVERIGDENTRMGNGNTGFRLLYRIAADSSKELTSDRRVMAPALD